MRVKYKKYTDDEINEFCQGVEKLLSSINERMVTKKRNKGAQVEEIAEDEDEVFTRDEDMFVIS